MGKTYKPRHKMPKKGRKRSWQGVKRAPQFRNTQVIQLPTYSQIIQYFFEHGEIRKNKHTRVYLTSQEFVVRTKQSVATSNLASTLLDEYSELRPKQMKYRGNTYYVDNLILDNLIMEKSYYDFVGVSYYDGSNWSLKHYDKGVLVDGVLMEKKSIKDLREAIMFVGVLPQRL